MARLYDRHLAPASISSSQFSILSLIEHNGKMTVAGLALAMTMERTTLVRALQPLQKEGWVVSRAPKHGRAMELSLAAAGKRKVDEAAPLWQSAQQAFDAEFGRERAIALRAALLDIGQTD